jgi:prevent-host-death family protein
MKTIAVSRAKLGDIFDSVVESRQPVRLTSRNSAAIIVGWEEWTAIEQTLLRLSTPTPSASASIAANARS